MTSTQTYLNIIFLDTPPGVFPARVLSGGSCWAGWGGLRHSRTGGLSWWRAAPLQAGVHRAGAGSSRPTGLLSNQQVPLPLHQWEHATPSSLQHGEAAERWNEKGYWSFLWYWFYVFSFIADSQGAASVSRVWPWWSRVLSAGQPAATTT